MRYGLVGKKLAHSRSPMIHGMFGNQEYGLFERTEEEFDDFIINGDYLGLNITIPYKENALAVCEPDSSAKAIGSVNTIVRRGDKRLGYNTDYPGFMYMLKKAGISLSGKKVIILGTGGTSKTAVYAAKTSGASQIVTISRTGQDNYDNIHKHFDADIVINTTPVGMYPANQSCPISLDCFERLSGVVDVIYNPIRTELIMSASKRGIPCTGGLPMLLAQGFYADRLFFDKPQTDCEAELDRLYDLFLKQMQNIVLIGMPGCGKTTIGRLLSERLGFGFADTDEIITNVYGKQPSAIITQMGEPFFRGLESGVVSDVSKNTGFVIATGGGSVLAPESRLALKQNGFIVFLDQQLEKLATDNRPLSADLKAMEAKRRPIYEGFADLIIPMETTVETNIQTIMEALS